MRLLNSNSYHYEILDLALMILNIYFQIEKFHEFALLTALAILSSEHFVSKPIRSTYALQRLLKNIESHNNTHLINNQSQSEICHILCNFLSANTSLTPEHLVHLYASIFTLSSTLDTKSMTYFVQTSLNDIDSYSDPIINKRDLRPLSKILIYTMKARVDPISVLNQIKLYSSADPYFSYQVACLSASIGNFRAASQILKDQVNSSLNPVLISNTCVIQWL
ncbi:MAG: hypothetical protein MHMPM18_003902 [Marteilia pararefringens]